MVIGYLNATEDESSDSVQYDKSAPPSLPHPQHPGNKQDVRVLVSANRERKNDS